MRGRDIWLKVLQELVIIVFRAWGRLPTQLTAAPDQEHGYEHDPHDDGGVAEAVRTKPRNGAANGRARPAPDTDIRLDDAAYTNRRLAASAGQRRFGIAMPGAFHRNDIPIVSPLNKKIPLLGLELQRVIL